MVTGQLASTAQQNHPYTDRTSCAPKRLAGGGQARKRARQRCSATVSRAPVAVAVPVHAVRGRVSASLPTLRGVSFAAFVRRRPVWWISSRSTAHRASAGSPLAQCGKREPLIGVRFSDRSRDPYWSKDPFRRGDNPRFSRICQPSGGWGTGPRLRGC